MTTPRILVIDDLFGASHLDRQNLCRSFGLLDTTGDDPRALLLDNPVAEAVFCSGQSRDGQTIQNDVSVVFRTLEQGVRNTDESTPLWSLLLLDLLFVSGEMDESGEPRGRDGDDTFGLVILEQLSRTYPDLPVIIISARERSTIIETCRKLGAIDFIQRHEYGTEVKLPKDLLKNKIIEHGLIPDNRALSDEGFRIVGRSLPLLKVLRAARRGATGKGNILILGETGTGKELLARYIRDYSPKHKGPYNIFHAFGQAEGLQEDELFGHVKGAYTGASTDREGLFEKSDGGTLFIDEIGDIPEGLQLKLLRPLESRSVTRQGGSTIISLDIQVLLATNKNLEEYAASGMFRNDLLNRINAYQIIIPPLRERRKDISAITEHLLERVCKENMAKWPRKILPDALQLFISNEWKDNVRGLRNAIERAVKNNSDSELLMASDLELSQEVQRPSSVTAQPEPASLSVSSLSIDQLIDLMRDFRFPVDYGGLVGRYPDLHQAFSTMTIQYLNAALQATRKRKPNATPEEEINLTAAASCMIGDQLKTSKAADLIKKIFQNDKSALDAILKDNPLLAKVYEDVLRLRPTNPFKKRGSSDG